MYTTVTCIMTVSIVSCHHNVQVTMMIDNGQELGISIRGGAEHGLGIYVSAVEGGSVAEAYGVNVRVKR